MLRKIEKTATIAATVKNDPNFNSQFVTRYYTVRSFQSGWVSELLSQNTTRFRLFFAHSLANNKRIIGIRVNVFA